MPEFGPMMVTLLGGLAIFFFGDAATRMKERWRTLPFKIGSTETTLDKKMIDTNTYRVMPGKVVKLSKWQTLTELDLKKKEAKSHFRDICDELVELQRVLYAEQKHKLLIVFQGMDGSGKDSTIRKVIGPMNPHGCRVVDFKVPTATDLAHDYLWRIHAQVPSVGMIGVFNRSHYESLTVERVKEIATKEVWKKRFEHVNAFEKMLADEGTKILKFFLHISPDHQKARLLHRMNNPEKHWKLDPSDFTERKRWDEYEVAYEEAITKTSTKQNPWYIIPAEIKLARNVIVGKIVLGALKSLDMKYPEPKVDPSEMQLD